MKNKVGVYIILLLLVIPIIIWLLMEPISLRFSNFINTFTSLGEISGLIGVVLFSVSFILSARLKSLEDYFGGLDKMYIVHHVVGGLAFVFLLFHPLFFASTYVVYSFKDAALFLLPGANLAYDLGILALFSMMLLLVFTFFVKLKYPTWKNSHQFLGVSFVLAAAHVFLISSDVSRNVILRYYIFLVILLGMIAMLYRVVFYNFLVKRYKYTVLDVKKINNTVVEISLVPAKEKMKYKAGQFLFVSFKSKDVKEVHPFTISSSPNENILRITVKSLGDYTNKIQALEKGVLAEIEGPFGRFCSEDYADKFQIWIAGGIGITPFLSMARNIKDDQKVDLYYNCGREEDALFLPEILKISSSHKHFKVYPGYTTKEGRLTADFIKQKSGKFLDEEIFICGPVLMVQDLTSQFVKLGVKKNKIHFEEFSLK